MRIVKHERVSLNSKGVKLSRVCPLQYTCLSFNLIASLQKHIAVCFA